MVELQDISTEMPRSFREETGSLRFRVKPKGEKASKDHKNRKRGWSSMKFTYQTGRP